ncbi:MAG: hypothetical protein ACXV2C_06140 [Candidatus Bathyarchaeia archaeon]
MTESIDAEITIKQKELDVRKLEMEDIRTQFIEASAVFIAQWYNETAKHHVYTNSRNTLSLGRDKLSSMKGKLKDLTQEAGKIANELLSDHSLWWHLMPKNENENPSLYVQYGNRCPDTIDTPIRKALGKLGVILEEYGYNVATKGGGTGDDVSVWNNKNVSPYPINSVPYYPNSYDWSKEMKDIMKRYNEIYKQAYDYCSNIKHLQQLKMQKLAIELWDSS